jgi:hypothetical protein
VWWHQKVRIATTSDAEEAKRYGKRQPFSPIAGAFTDDRRSPSSLCAAVVKATMQLHPTNAFRDIDTIRQLVAGAYLLPLALV